MQEKLISIVIPVYNIEKYLEKCLLSVTSQTYKNLEIILVDDGSDDNSPHICDEFAKSDNRIYVIHKQNGGVSQARNDGINAANGDYLMFVDGDDWVEEDICEKMILLFNDDIDIAFCRPMLDFENGKSQKCIELNLPKLAEKPYDITNILIAKTYYKDANGNLVRDNVAGYTWRTLLKLDIIKKNNISYNSKIRFSEDVLFLIEYLSFCKQGAFLDEYLYHYRQERDDRATIKYSHGYIKNFFETRNQLLEFEEEVINKSKSINSREKQFLISYLRLSLSLSVFQNEVLYNNENCVSELKKVYKDKKLRKYINLSSFKTMYRLNMPIKKVMIFVFIKFRMWNFMKKYFAKRIML